MPEGLPALDPEASEGGSALMAPPVTGYAGADPVLRNPEFQQFVPPGFSGTRFQLPPDNAAALHAYVTHKADQEARDQQMMQQAIASRRVEDAYKATTAARKFMATRKLGMDYSSLMQSGLPHEQALSLALQRNAPDLLGTDPRAFMGMMRGSRTPQQATIVPATGSMPGYVKQPTGHITWMPRTTDSEETKTRKAVTTQTSKFIEQDISDLRAELKAFDKENAGSKTEDTVAQRANLVGQIADKQRTLLALKAGGVTIIPEKSTIGGTETETASPEGPVGPATKSAPKYKWDSKLGRLVKVQ